MVADSEPRGPLHVSAEVLANRPLGAFRSLTLRVPGVGARVRPGNFVMTSIPGPRLGRRALWVHRVRAAAGDVAALEVVVASRGPGSAWLTQLSEGATFSLTGPLGRPFALPRESVPCVLVGESWQAAPLFILAERLAQRECPTTLLLGGSTVAEVLPATDLRRVVRSVLVATEDGSMGQPGTVLELLPDVLARTGAAVVYASGTPATMAAVAAQAESQGVWAQVTLSPRLTCGTGFCFGCPVPARSEGGGVREVRACTEGPVFRGDRVAWAEVPR